jgi:hypothetical protein
LLAESEEANESQYALGRYRRPERTSFDLSVGKDSSDRFSASLRILNVLNRRVDLDNSQTFGGFDWNKPREIFAELRYRFYY